MQSAGITVGATSCWAAAWVPPPRQARPAAEGEAMLPDFRFVIGATLATAMLGIAIFGLSTAVRLSHEAKVGPPETLRISAFDKRADWNQFSDPELARRFDALARQAEAGAATPVPEAVAAAEVPQPALAVPALEAPAPNELPASIPPNSEANLTAIEDGPTTIDDMATRSEQEPLLESAPAAIASLPTQEPVVTGAIAKNQSSHPRLWRRPSRWQMSNSKPVSRHR